MTTNKRRATSATTAAAAVTAITAMLASNACPAQAFQPSAFIATPVQRSFHRNHHVARVSSSPVSSDTAVSMRSSPWDPSCYSGGNSGMDPFSTGGFGSWPPPGAAVFGGGPVVYGPAGIGFQAPPTPTATTRVGEPVVTSDTETVYKLTFALPDDIDDDGLDVSVSGRLLTVKAKVTRDEDPRTGGRGRPVGGGWVSRSSRTDTLSRQFVVPDGVSTAGVKATWKDDGTVDVKFIKRAGETGARPAGNKTAGGTAAAATTTKTETSQKALAPNAGVPRPKTTAKASSVGGGASKAEKTSASAGAAGGVKIGNAVNDIGDAAATAASAASVAADYLAGLSSFIEENNKAAQKAKVAAGAVSSTPPSRPPTSSSTTTAENNANIAMKAEASTIHTDNSVGNTSDGAAPRSAESSGPASKGRPSPPRSVLEALDQEFGEFAKLMWGEENAAQALKAAQEINGANFLRFPNEEEMAARVEAARNARAASAEAAREHQEQRIKAMKRASMAADLSEQNGSYLVRIALPEGATRSSVSLSVTPENALRVSFTPHGSRLPFTRDVRLPRDAQIASISAKFLDDDQVSGGVMGLEVTVGKVAGAPESGRINIT